MSAESTDPVQLPTRQGPPKKPFGTQLRLDTIARLKWARRHRGVNISEAADQALNELLDRAGVPRPDANGVMPEGGD